MNIQKAKTRDIPHIKELLIQNDLPVEDLKNEIDFFIEKTGNNIVVCGGLEKAGTFGLIRSIAVHDNYKGQSNGFRMTHFLISRAKKMNLKALFLLTTTAEAYFSRFGFDSIPRKFAPNEIKKTTEFSSVCPDTAAFMKMNLR